MKARVKATGEIVDGTAMVSFNGDDFYLDELEAIQDDTDKEYDELDVAYWENMKHQYAGMAMQGMVRTIGHDRMYPPEKIAIYAVACATALVEKLKEESK